MCAGGSGLSGHLPSMVRVSSPAGPHRRRPLLAADVERLARGASDGDPYAQLELAHATAAAVVRAGRDDEATTGDLVRLVDTVGLETLAELWQDAAADSLPGALWALYLLHTWCESQGEQVARLYREGRGYAPVDEVVAGVHDAADPQALRDLAAAILSGAYEGDFAGALDRAASFFRVIAAGRQALAADGETDELRRAGRNLDRAGALHGAAQAWRAGRLR